MCAIFAKVWFYGAKNSIDPLQLIGARVDTARKKIQKFKIRHFIGRDGVGLLCDRMY